jgi:hypothetical protein
VADPRAPHPLASTADDGYGFGDLVRNEAALYVTCLFCNGRLGRNEALHHFPVGRRLAYDAARGRLWVVCRLCERWNLTPLEERWEAIEEAERAFRAARLRIATDNIALARMREGLELVRIGAPPRLELAQWRYGYRFRRRRRQALALGTLGAFAGSIPVALLAASAPLVAASGATLGLMAAGFWNTRRDIRNSWIIVPDGEGAVLPLKWSEVRTAALVRVREVGDWCLTVAAPPWLARASRRETLTLRGDDARRALASMLPWLNHAGGSVRRVAEAVAVISDVANPHQLLYSASGAHSSSARPSYVGSLPTPMRLALEMVLHEDDEHRAMQGELLELEARWRAAEEIARIADALALPRELTSKLERLRGTGDTS